MNIINTLKNIYNKIKLSYDNYWEEYEKEMQSLPEEVRTEMRTMEFNIINQY